MKHKTIKVTLVLTILFLTGILKYTDILVLDSGNEITSTGVLKVQAAYPVVQSVTQSPITVEDTNHNVDIDTIRINKYGGEATIN